MLALMSGTLYLSVSLLYPQRYGVWLTDLKTKQSRFVEMEADFNQVPNLTAGISGLAEISKTARPDARKIECGCLRRHALRWRHAASPELSSLIDSAALPKSVTQLPPPLLHSHYVSPITNSCTLLRMVLTPTPRDYFLK